MIGVGKSAFSKYSLIFSLLMTACQTTGHVENNFDAKTYRYQNSAGLFSFFQITVPEVGEVEISYTDEAGNGFAEAASRNFGETILVVETPSITFYLPAKFNANTHKEWSYRDCKFEVLEKGNFFLGADASPLANIRAMCKNQPIADYYYSSEFGLLSITFGDKPIGAGDEDHSYTANQTYWLLTKQLGGFSPQPK